LKVKSHVIGAAVFLLIRSGACSFLRHFERASHPSDASLIANFSEHRPAFDKLIELAIEDKVDLTIYNDREMFAEPGNWPKSCDNCVSADRWAEYQTVFVKLGDPQPLELTSRNRMMLMPVSFRSTEPDGGLESLTSEKGYVYSERNPWPVVESLDGMGFDTKGTFFKKISGSWYLYHEWGVSKPE